MTGNPVTYPKILADMAFSRGDLAMVLIMLGVASAPCFMNDAARQARESRPWIAAERPNPHAGEIRHGDIHIFL